MTALQFGFFSFEDAKQRAKQDIGSRRGLGEVSDADGAKEEALFQVLSCWFSTCLVKL